MPIMLRMALSGVLGVAAAAVPAAGGTGPAEPLCQEQGLWGTAWCLATETAGLAGDAAAFALTAASEALPPGWAGSLAALRPPPELVHALKGVLQGAPAALARRTYGAAEQLLPQGAVLGLRRAAARGGAAFAAAFPERARLLTAQAGDEESAGLAALAAAAWLALAALLAARCARALCRRRARRSEVLFFPDRSGRHLARLCTEVARARSRIWLAMFSLTDDSLCEALLKAHRRGVDVRIIVDDDQSKALGADASRLCDAGVPVATDKSWARMHHKFMVLDHAVFSGSFNWTRQASTLNCENVCILQEPHLVKAFAKEFSRLWREFAGGRARAPAEAASLASRGRPRGVEEASLKRIRRRDKTPPPPARGGC